MKIAIVNTLPVPSGNASVNRFLAYGKELVKLGVNVDVLTSAQCDNCEVDGINVISCGNGHSMFSALRRITKTIKKGKYNIVILISNSLLLIYPLWFACKRCGIKLLQEKSEFPFVLMKKGFLQKLYAKFYVNTTYKLFDGLIVMTKPLMEYFKTKVRKNCRLFEMPMSVDTDRFINIQNSENKIGGYLAYCGNLSNKKDGVLNLIEAFSMVEPLFPQIKLVLIGGTSNNEDMGFYKDAVAKYDLKNVIFYGGVSRDEMPSLLINAKALLLARPSSLQSTGGFPTKLGEYLATGNPVVVTAVGDIPLYLNETNSFIVRPDDNNAFAEQILAILNNETKAIEVGQKGKELAMTVFNAKIQSQKLYKYLESL